MIARKPRYRCGVSFRSDAIAAGAAEGSVWIVVNLAAFYDGDLRVHEAGQAAQNSRFSLPTQTQQNEMMAREYGVDDLGDDGIVVAVETGEKRFAFFHFLEQVFAKLLAYRAMRDFFFRPIAPAKFAKRFWHRSHEGPRFIEKTRQESGA